VNTVWQELNSARAKDEIVRNGQTARHTALAAQLLTSQKELAELQTLTVQYNELTRRVQEGDSNYKAFAEKRDEAQIADAMDRQKLLNVAIAEPPTSSVIPVRPRRMMNLALGLFTAFFLACCLVFFAEISREDVTTPAELQACGGYPVLAATPFRKRKREIPPKHSDHLLHDGNRFASQQNDDRRRVLQTRQPLIAQNAQSSQERS
jgi:capsular polysaccharide biosynthesis protein